jgi:hypothetical protein
MPEEKPTRWPALTPDGQEQIKRAFELVHADDERRAQAGMIPPEHATSLIGLDASAFRHFACDFDGNTLPEYRAYAEEIAEAFAVGVLSCSWLSWPTIARFRVICRLHRLPPLKVERHGIFAGIKPIPRPALELWVRCWAVRWDGILWTFEPAQRAGPHMLHIFPALLRNADDWGSILWLRGPGGAFSCDYPGKLRPEYVPGLGERSRSGKERMPYTLLRIDNVGLVRQRANQVRRYVSLWLHPGGAG